MYALFKLLFACFPHDDRPSVDDAFLAASTDLLDLERRQRALDERGRDPRAGIALGLYAC